MRVRNLIEALSKMDPEAEVSLYTGWEGMAFMTPNAIALLPGGIRDHKVATVLIYHGDPRYCPDESVKEALVEAAFDRRLSRRNKA